MILGKKEIKMIFKMIYKQTKENGEKTQKMKIKVIKSYFSKKRFLKQFCNRRCYFENRK